ncbi:putative oxidoreductase [Neofusicoccum parvum]|uniref:Oxidoreductase n=1 Tax=Neofusicoccum parvum TaxID=310453 RepID=A0ACB5RN26_9PEZI|nr:putative oxidoreductase [Neofusicoccum parvum]
MLATRAERCFYQAFFRWNSTSTSSRHAACRSCRLFSSHPARNDSDKDNAEEFEIIGFATKKERERRRLQATVRSVFRSVPQPIAIVTALAEDQIGSLDGSTTLTSEYEEALKQMRAMTISSLNTVSLVPSPVVSFNIRVPSSTWDAIRVQSRFRIHLLKATERGSEIAESFARGDTHAGLIRQLKLNSTINLNRPGGILRLHGSTTEWRTVEANMDPNPAPYLRSAGVACCMLVELRPEACVEVNDHVIVVADVREVIGGDISMFKNNSVPGQRQPVLSYYNREFVRVDTPVSSPVSSPVQDPEWVVMVRKDVKSFEDKGIEGQDKDGPRIRRVLASKNQEGSTSQTPRIEGKYRA